MLKSILIAILLLLSINAYAQFDSAEVKAIRLIIEQNEYRGVVIDSLGKKVNLLYRRAEFYKTLYETADSVCSLKEQQIIELEKRPAIIENKTSFFTYLAIILSSISAGLITGILIDKP